MTELTREKLLFRFRHMVTQSGVAKKGISDEELLRLARGDTEQEKLHSMEVIISLTSPSYWAKIEKMN